MAINFPASPSANDIHQVGSQIWFWNGTYWELKSNVTKFSSQDAAPSSPIAGDIWYETDTGKLFMRYDSYWVEIGHSSDGQSFQAQDAAPSSPAANDIWYESDTGKTFIYYDSYWVEIGHASDADVSAYAPLASPTLTGTPAAPTASANTSTTQLATTAFVMTEVGDYAPLASPTLTGTPAAPTAAADTNTTQIATTAYVQTELGAISSDSLSDADSDTKIQVEESADEDKIRFDIAGTQVAVLDGTALDIAGNVLYDIDIKEVNESSGTTYTFVLADRGQFLRVGDETNNTSANSITVPPNSSVAFPIGCQIQVACMGGEITMVAGSGVTLRYTPGLKLRAQFSTCTCIKIATDEWILIGDLDDD